MSIRPYHPSDLPQVLRIFQLNIPEYFVEEEAWELELYLIEHPDTYLVMEEAYQIVGGAGIILSDQGETGSITWVFFHPEHQGKGFGRALVNHCLEKLRHEHQVNKVIVKTSQLAAGFFSKFGLVVEATEKDFWAPGLDLHWMEMEW